MFSSSFTLSILLLLLLTLTLTSTSALTRHNRLSPVIFRDVSLSADLKRPYGRRKKYGGACVADLNADGLPDLLLAHHGDRWMQAYLNLGSFRFRQILFHHWADIHGITAVRLSPYHSTLHFTLSRGGRNGQLLAPVYLFHMLANGTIQSVSGTRTGDLDYVASAAKPRGRGTRGYNKVKRDSDGVKVNVRGRGRSTLFLNLHAATWRSKPFPDMLSLNAPDGSKRHHKAFAGKWTGRFQYRTLSSAFRGFPSGYALATDVDNDRRMEVVLFHNLSFWKLQNDFHFRDVTAGVLPEVNRRGSYTAVGAMAELDYDNDGFWDLFVTQSASSELDWIRRRPLYDGLLRNIGGKRYVDVSQRAGIPFGKESTYMPKSNMSPSRGITTGDFNNDGYIDIFICLFDHSDKYHLLLNNGGDGTFSTIRGIVHRDAAVHGDAATAVDLDEDGRLDLVLSEGDWFKAEYGGYYRLLQNITPIGKRNTNRFLLVRVLNAPRKRATALHAVVEVWIGQRQGHGRQRLSMRRRVSNPGVTVSQSFIETVHFGIARHDVVDMVRVTWSDGSRVTRWKVKANTKITIGEAS